ncbi:MAG: urease accessory protein UreE [Alistipes sp.]|nr:urease accessory protein UreE [Alistipes sp.]
MKIYTEIIGNMGQASWHDRLKEAQIEYVDLDQWTAQKSRFVATSDATHSYAVALKRHAQLLDGDILEYDPEGRRAVVIRIQLNEVMCINLEVLPHQQPEEMIRRAVELGHAIGNQHWPAVVKGTRIYVPLTVDRKVMMSVMNTHHFEVIPYLAPHEIRRLFGGTGPQSHTHEHCTGEVHDHAFEEEALSETVGCHC